MRLYLRQRESVLALVLVLSMLGAELLSVAHNATVRHIYCFAHHHMMDADDSLEGHRLRPVSRETPDADGSDALPEITSAERENSHRHLHCDKSVFLKSGDLPVVCAISLLQAAAYAGAAQPVERLVSPPVPLLLLAPKNSPPACA